MRYLIIFFLLLTFTSGCAKGYKEGEPLTGAELELAQQATKLASKVNELNDDVPAAINDQWKGFSENVKLFDNSCQRHSCNSLEARNDFNHLRYYAVQLDEVITSQAHPDLYPKWEEIRRDYVDSIGKELGYRIE
jgi:hypothetical protein